MQSRSFTDLNDGIDALIKIIGGDPNKLNGKIFNIGNPEGNLTIKELATKMVKIYNEISPKPFKGNIIEKPEAEFYGKGYEDVPTRVPDISEAKNVLGWQPNTMPDEAIRLTIQSFIVL